jgi:hypothetical protein
LEGAGFSSVNPPEAVLVPVRAGFETVTVSEPGPAASELPGLLSKTTTSGSGRAVGPLARSMSAETVERAKAAAACSAGVGWNAASGLNTRIQR